VRIRLAAVVPEDNAHSPNEKFDLDCFENGQRMSALLWQELSNLADRAS
jgi:acetylornithine deacetylase/succinyl-diaminopimelate desuccinylase-like protein